MYAGKHRFVTHLTLFNLLQFIWLPFVIIIFLAIYIIFG